MQVETFTQAVGDTPLLKDKVFTGRFLCAGTKAYNELGIVINIEPENLMRIAEKHQGVPVIINHKNITQENILKEKVGSVARVFLNDQGFERAGKKYAPDDWAWCDFVVDSQKAIDLLTKYNWDLSNSYTPIQKTASSEATYDVEVVDGEGLHLAIVPEGRYDTQVILCNEKPENNNLSKKTMSIINNAKKTFFGSKAVNNSDDNKIKHEAAGKPEENFVENSTEGNPCGEKKYENKHWIHNGEKISIEEVRNTLMEHKKHSMENEMSLDEEYDVDGEMMTGHDMIQHYFNIKEAAPKSEDDKIMTGEERPKETHLSNSSTKGNTLSNARQGFYSHTPQKTVDKIPEMTVSSDDRLKENFKK